MAHGSWLMAHGSWLMAHGSWLMAHGSWLMAHGSWLMAHGSWLMASLISLSTSLKEAAAKHFFSRNLPRNSDADGTPSEEERFLVEKLKIPQQWIEESWSWVAISEVRLRVNSVV